MSGELQIGYFTMIIALLISLFGSIKSLTQFVLDGNWYVKIFEAFYDIVKHDSKPTKAIKYADSENPIEIQDLAYQYPQSESFALNGINLISQKDIELLLLEKMEAAKPHLYTPFYRD